MAISVKSLLKQLTNTVLLRNIGLRKLPECRSLSALPSSESKYEDNKSSEAVKGRKVNPPQNVRLVYPEFLPDPDPKYRNPLKEHLERQDMLARRKVIDIPEFYVGSILSITTSDEHAQTKINKFVGICIKRSHTGLRSDFTLRNIIDGQGVEIRYMLYDPTIRQIQVLRLEKRLDEVMEYLRDADPIHSTFLFDMEPEILPEGCEVPVNETVIELKTRPWTQKWWLKGLKGVGDFEKHYRMREKGRMERNATPFLKYDLMKQYRETIPEEDQNEIWSEVYKQLDHLRTMRKKMARKRAFSFPKKSG